MNFLAHIYLSGEQEEILVGNFMGDYVKGKNYLDYPDEIQKGILLHRNIDYYTDCHPITRKSKRHVEKYYRKYAGIIIDIFYDYFLASEWDLYCPISLESFVENTFNTLKKNYNLFPEAIKTWFPNFIRNNWLISYSTEKGVENVLHRMSSRTSLPEYTDYAIDILKREKEKLREEFNEFFPSIRNYIFDEFGIETGCPPVNYKV